MLICRISCTTRSLSYPSPGQVTVAAGLGVPPRADSHCKFSGALNFLRAPLCCLLCAFQHDFYTSRMRTLSLSLHLHVRLPAASPS